MLKAILITGATGMIGKALTDTLLNKGHIVHHLTRKSTISTNPNLKKFTWDVFAGTIDEKCIEGVGAVIHLAGENIAEKPWTKKRRLELTESRTKSIHLIYELLKKSSNHGVKTVVSASGIGFYGDRGNTLLTETSAAGAGFLSAISVQWEKAVDAGSQLNLRIVKLRSGIVLDIKEGALPELSKPVKAGFPAALGKGTQWMPWIHLIDTVNLYLYALENETMNGAYNMAAPGIVTNEQFMQILAEAYHKKCWLPHVPSIALRLLLGKMSEMLLMSTRTSSDKILQSGFEFQFPELKAALRELVLTKEAPVNN
ncbi:MAG TPA: TIGR01777 family oxidoreductase [Sphingobacteriaceae bacterium]|nr:TIGR01777 family oxidoreductase [Sphingobacteriaceae bacterium]